MSNRVSLKEIFISLGIAVGVFLVLGTVTSLWNNPFFARMTGVNTLDYLILGMESLLFGLLLGVKTGSCSVKSAGTGGVLGFLGFACPVCNKLLLLIFGGTFLMTYFEPIRPLLGLLGILILAYLLYKKLWIKQNLEV